MRKLALFLFSVVLLAGCAPIMVSLPYQPVTTEEIKGGVQVAQFSYFPKEGVQKNQIENTAAQTMLLTENVADFYTSAVSRELRQAGVSLKGQCVVTGEINRFLVDDLGFSCTYLTDVRYILQDKDKKVLFDSNYKVEFTTSKFVVAQVIYANLNKVVSDNIVQLLKDKNFSNAVETQCKMP